MHLNRLMDQLIFRSVTKDIDTKLIESSCAKRESIPNQTYPNILHFGDLNPYIEFFINTFKENFTEEQTKAMLYRLNYLEITEDIGVIKGIIQTVVSLGCYHSASNSITISHYKNTNIPVEMWETLIHELMHMASTKNTQIGFITGLEIPDILGNGLNEGYTEYLTQKYFTKKMKYTESEDFSVFFAKGIENIVGPEKMQECYFNANLGSLIEELEQYASKEDILKLLFLIDQEKTPFANRKNHRIIMRQIARMNARKLSQDLLSNRITKEQYDIEYAIKVEEYKKYRLWSEETRVLRDEDDFILEDQGRQSDLYEFTKSNEKPKYFEKKYQE